MRQSDEPTRKGGLAPSPCSSAQRIAHAACTGMMLGVLGGASGCAAKPPPQQTPADVTDVTEVTVPDPALSKTPDPEDADAPAPKRIAVPPDPGGRSADCCKGMNECKGQGACATARNDCAGKNECKGLGGCAAHCPK